MAAEYIHVKIGLVDAVYPVLEFITTGSFKDFYHFRTSPTTTAWTHKQWCTPCLADGTSINAAHDDTDTDWRTFLKSHWDTEHNRCQVEHLNEFYAIFRRAAANYMRRKSTTHVEYTAAPQQPVKQKTAAPAKPKKTHYVQLSLFD